MATTTKLKETFEVESKHGAFYTGGNVEWHEETIFCQTESSVSLLNVNSGLVEKIGAKNENEDFDTIQTFTTDSIKIVTAHKSSLLKLWNLKGELEKVWKCIHKGPIARLRLNGSKLATGGSDSTVRLWDLTHEACTANLRGCQGVINVLEWQNDSIYASGDTGDILKWHNNLTEIYKGHYSKVTSLIFASDDKFVTCGRDKCIILWEIGKLQPLKVVPVHESIEVITRLSGKFKLPNFKPNPEGIYVASGGNLGVVRVWDVNSCQEIYKQENSLVSKSEDGGLAITQLVYNEKMRVLGVISSEHNIILYNLKSFVCLKQFIGFSDEILDVCFVGKTDDFLAVASNSPDIKLYENDTMNCQLLKGHTDLVLALASSKTNPNLLLSSSKDNTVRLWTLNESKQMICVAWGQRHTAAVTAIAFCHSDGFVSASRDNCLKSWQITKNSDIKCTNTTIAHEKDINHLSVSPNNKLIASASQDKTVKLWSDTLCLIGCLKGHKRSVWSVCFSPVDQVLVSSSADCTLKLWSIGDLSCLKTIQGHEASVLKALFMTNGLQILSIGADGLLKLFNLKSSECILTQDEHLGKIWALTVKRDESGFVTGGSDSLLIKWKDVTEERQLDKLKMEEELLLEEQKLNNFVQNNELLKALKLGLKLDRPFKVLGILQKILVVNEDLNGLIRGLKDDYKENLMRFALNWNMNSKNCYIGQLVLNILLNDIQNGNFKPSNLSGNIEGILPYTERHFKRLTNLMQDLYFINYTVNCMQPFAKK